MPARVTIAACWTIALSMSGHIIANIQHGLVEFEKEGRLCIRVTKYINALYLIVDMPSPDLSWADVAASVHEMRALLELIRPRTS
jgi:hypothetical protein